MQRSSNRNPCPCCGRTKTSHCAWTINGSEDDTILCHLGERWGPPAGLAIGDVIDINGREWALTATDKGFANRSHVFRPHKNNVYTGVKLSRFIRQANSKLLSVEPLHDLRPSVIWQQIEHEAKILLNGSIHAEDRIGALDSLLQRCKSVVVKLKRGEKADPTLQPYLEKAIYLLRVLRYERLHRYRCATEPAYEAAMGHTTADPLEWPESDWSYWQQQKACKSHPWVLECQAAGEFNAFHV